MPTIAETAPVSRPALWMGRVLSGLVIVFMLFDGAIKLVPWPVVTETMDRIGYGSSETLARSLGVISIVCTALSGRPRFSISTGTDLSLYRSEITIEPVERLFHLRNIWHRMS